MGPASRPLPAAYFMPVSFAAILGGVVTLIGTSTNVAVSGLLEESGSRPLGLVEIGKVGLLIAVAGVALLVLAAPRLRRGIRPRDAVDLNVVVLIAASFGLGAAIDEQPRRGGRLALVSASERLGDYSLLAGALLATIILTEPITNDAAAVLMFPIAVSTAGQAGLDPRPFAIAAAIGASWSFLTPVGYQTNTMVYGMGGYRFWDFARVGLPLTVLVLVIALLLIPVSWPLR